MKIIEIFIRIISLTLWICAILPMTLLISFLIWDKKPIRYWSVVCWVNIMKEVNEDEIFID